MKKKSLLPFVSALSVCCLCLSIAIFVYWDLTRFPTPLLPPLIAEPAVIDFGEIQGQGIVQGKSSIKNTTKQPIRILHTIISCSCNNVRLKQGELLQGEVTELLVDWDLRGRAGNTTVSLAVVYVLEGDDMQQVLPVKLRANVVSYPP